MRNKIIISLVLLVVIFSTINVYAVETSYEANVTLRYEKDKQDFLNNAPEIGCRAAYVANPITGKIIYEKNAHEKMFPASTTKILTALVTMENCKMDDTAIVTQYALDLVPEGYSNAKLQEGEEHTIKDLLYALLLPSANEAANVLAQHISGSVEEFADLCNKRAKELGCETLHFVNANGMHDDNHYCSAYDLYLVAVECQKYDIFNEIVKTKTYTLPSTEIYPETRTIKNTNELLFNGKYYYSNCTGIKTGHTTPAGECLVASSSYNNIDIVSVVLGGELENSQGLNDRFYDTKRLFEYTYDNYSINKIAEYGDAVATLNVGKATKDTAVLNVVVDTDISTIVPININKNNVKATISINENIVAPIEENQVLGQITYNADGLIYTTNIIASHSVDKLPYARYNMIVVSSISITFVVFILLIVIFKKHKKIVIIVELVIIVCAYAVIIPHVKEDLKNSTTQINLAPNVTINKNGD